MVDMNYHPEATKFIKVTPEILKEYLITGIILKKMIELLKINLDNIGLILVLVLIVMKILFKL